MTRAAEPLIPRRTLFDNPTFFGAKISPDGRWISWLAPVDGVLNVWMSPADDIKAGEPGDAHQGSAHQLAGLVCGRPLPDVSQRRKRAMRTIICSSSIPQRKPCVTLRHSPMSASCPALWSLDAPGDVAVKINDRDARWHDLYRIDLATGRRTLIWENTQRLANIGLDWQLRPRYARSNAPDGGSKLWRIDGTTLSALARCALRRQLDDRRPALRPGQ